MKFPQKMACVDDTYMQPAGLINGRIYTVLREDSEGYFVQGVDQEFCYKWRFKPLANKLLLGWAVRYLYRDGSKNYVGCDGITRPRYLFATRDQALDALCADTRFDSPVPAQIIRVVRRVP